MPIQPIRSVITTLTIATWACIQFTNGLSAQDASSRRTAPLQVVSIPDSRAEPVAVAKQLPEKPKAVAVTQSDESIELTDRSLQQVSNRRKQTHTPAVFHTENLGSELRVTRTTPMQPIASILPAAYIADQVPVPSLEDPEMFRVPSVDSNWHSDQSPPRPTGSYSSLPMRKNQVTTHPAVARFGAGNFVLPRQQSQQKIAAARENEDSLLDRLPISNLYEGIVRNPVAQASVRQTVGDPYLASRSYSGSNLRAGAGSMTKTWRSPNMRHRPLYFEEPNLERYGHTHPRLQPLLSGAHFFANVALLPYNTGVTPSSTCQYSIGHNRPGDCVPKVREQHPFNPRAAARQALVVGGGIAGL